MCEIHIGLMVDDVLILHLMQSIPHIHDTPRHQGLRRALLQSLRDKGITEERVMEAMMRVPRHLFLRDDTIFENKAYEDIAFPIGEGQTISQPHTVAYQTQLLELTDRERVLEVGTGSGYQAAVLHEMGVRVFSIERQRKLFDTTKKLLSELGYRNIKMYFGDGYEGLPAFAPFDKILITAAAPELPTALLSQLMLGGQMVLPLDIEGTTRMIRITRTEEDEYEREIFAEAAFVPMLRGKVL
jgi:protein-L-isoaspartate(D-aspartate) O-methyltransferase